MLGPVATIVGVLAAPGGPTPLPGGGSLRWDAPPGCPDATQVAGLVDEHLGDAAPEVQAVTADASVRESDGGRWSVALTLRSGEGEAAERTMTVASCDAAGQAVALAVALAAAPATPRAEDGEPDDEASAVPIVPTPDAPDDHTPTSPSPDDAVAGEGPTPTDESRPGEGTEPTPAAMPGDERVTSRGDADTPRPTPARPRVRGFLGAGGGVAGGVLPNPSGHVLVEGGLLGRRWEVALRADYVVQRRVRLPARPDAGGVLSTFGGGVLAGPWFELGPIELPVLAGVVAGAFRAEGFGSSSNATRSTVWIAALVDAGVRWAPLRRLAVDLRAELVVPFVRHTFTLGDPFVVARTGAVGGRGFATVALRLP